jgi:hypothetical protein
MRNTRIKRLVGVASVSIICSAGLSTQPRISSAQTAAKSGSHAANIAPYVNKRYGFRFYLPADWSGYSIVTSNWDGFRGGVSGKDDVAGPLITIRHPLWTEAQPRQDIPIMIYTHQQWDEVQRGTFSVSASPFPPSELGRNEKFVFALPSRYNYGFNDGFEEVQKILGNNPLKAF